MKKGDCMGKVILYIATSLDGYIADENGRVSFLEEFPLNEESQKRYASFYEPIGTIVMGRKTYDQVITELSPEKWPYEGMFTYVCSKTRTGKTEVANFTDLSPVELVKKIRGECHMDIWLVGGSELIDSFQKENLIDEYIITVVPTILGKGIPLFKEGLKKQRLRLVSSDVVGEFVETNYKSL